MRSKFDTLIDRAKCVPILDVAKQNLNVIRRVGRRYMTCCPFHDDDTPSLVFYEETNSFYCFGCTKGGDVIRFVELLHRCSFKEAVARLTENFSNE